MQYRAFFSYSRRDDRAANWLHRQLDGYRTPRRLVGVTGKRGEIPPKLYPIFRDRTDMSGGGDLSERITHALTASDALVVLCSPASAESQWVNREVEVFVGLGRGADIFPVIAPGLPDAPDVEAAFFPPALRGRGLIAADLRQVLLPSGMLIGDGRDGGRLKLIAGLLGADLEQVLQREQNRQRMLIAGLGAAAIAFAALAAAAAGLGFLAQRNATIAEEQRNIALANAAEATRQRDEAIAAREAERVQRGRADAEALRANRTLVAGVDRLSSVADLVLDDIRTRRRATAADIQIMRGFEDAFWRFGQIAPGTEFRPTRVGAVMEDLAATYAQIGRPQDAERVMSRFVSFNRDLARRDTRNPVWRSTHAVSLMRLSAERAQTGDRQGQAAALTEAAQLLEGLCNDRALVAPPGARTIPMSELRANSCVSFGTAVTMRLGMPAPHGRNVDRATIQRALAAVEGVIRSDPSNTYVQSAAPPTRDQLARALR